MKDTKINEKDIELLESTFNKIAQQGRSELVLEQVDKYMKMQKLVFSTKKPSKKEKQECKAQYDEIKSALQSI